MERRSLLKSFGFGAAALLLDPIATSAFVFSTPPIPEAPACRENHAHSPFCYGAIGDGVADDLIPLQQFFSANFGSLNRGLFFVSDTLVLDGSWHDVSQMILRKPDDGKPMLHLPFPGGEFNFFHQLELIGGGISYDSRHGLPDFGSQ